MGNEIRVDLHAGFLKSCLIAFEALLYFHFAFRAANKANFAPAALDQVLCRQFSTVYIITRD